MILNNRLAYSVKSPLRPNVCLSPGFESVEIGCPACAGVQAGNRPQPGAVHPQGVIVDARQVGLLCVIDPQRQTAVIGACGGRPTPIYFDGMRSVSDREPVRVDPGSSIVYQPRSDLIGSCREAQFHPEYIRGCTRITLKDVM